MDCKYEIIMGACLEWLRKAEKNHVHLTFLDPPFNQGKNYNPNPAIILESFKFCVVTYYVDILSHHLFTG